jgi:hypothetical protein
VPKEAKEIADEIARQSAGARPVSLSDALSKNTVDFKKKK